MKKSQGKRPRTEEGSSSYVPDDLLLSILLAASLKVLLACKTVSKPWLQFINSVFFRSEHFKLRRTCCLVRSREQKQWSREILLVEKEEFDAFHENADIGTILTLPDRQLSIANSCNGLLCLFSECIPVTPDLVCNPITREFIALPKIEAKFEWGRRSCGFGQSFVSSTYKIVRCYMAERLGSQMFMALVHTVGSSTWRQVEYPIPIVHALSSPTYFKGFVYWIALEYIPGVGQSRCLIRFDLETERFGFPIALPEFAKSVSSAPAIGVVGDRLCICSRRFDNQHHLKVWTSNMDGAGTYPSWAELFSFPSDTEDAWVVHPYVPIMFLNNGNLLFVHCTKNSFVDMDRIYRSPAFGEDFEALPHMESLLPLKVALESQGSQLKFNSY